MHNLIKVGKRWYSDFEHKGKRIRRFLSPYKDEAKALLPELKRRVKGERPAAEIGMSWREFCQRFLDYVQVNLNNSTVEKYRRAFALVDAYGDIRALLDMTPERLESLKVEWLKHVHPKKGIRWGDTSRIGLQSAYISVKCIKRAMRWAEDLKYAPLQNWRIVKTVEARGRLIHFSLAEFERFLKVCPPPYRMMAMLQGRGGLRSGEAWHLEWKDVQWDRHRLHIYSRPGWHIKGDRTGKAEKWIPIDADLEAYLQRNRKREGFLIEIRGYGERMNPKRFLTNMGALMRKAGLKGSPHALRHTCASLMVSNGATLEEVAGVLGHRPGSEVTQVYAHLSEEAKDRAVSRLPRLTFIP